MIYIVLVYPFVAAAIAYILRNLRPAAATFSSVAALVLAILLITGVGAPAESVLGRTLVLYAPMRAHLAFGLLLLTITFLSTWRLPENELGWMLAFMSVGFLLWSAAIQTVSLSALMLVASAVTMVISVAGAPSPANLWTIRVLALVVAAGMMMVVAAWLIEQPAGSTEGFLTPLGPILLFLGYWVLLAAFPFGVWQLPVLQVDASIPRVLAGIVLPHALLAQVLIQQQTVLAPINALVPALLLYSGLITLLAGGVGAAAQRNTGGLFAYLSLGELGTALIALGSGAVYGNTLGITLLVYRGIGLVGMSTGLRLLNSCLGSEDIERLRGAARRAPLAVAGTLLTGLSLAGFPPLASFTARFTLYRMIAVDRISWAVALVVASTLAALALTRVAVRAFEVVPVPGSRREKIGPAILVLVLGLVLLVLGFWPQGVSRLAGRWVDMLSVIALTTP